MNWTLITLPAPEELVWGYIPPQGVHGGNGRRWLSPTIAGLVLMALLSVRLAGIETDKGGERCPSLAGVSEQTCESRCHEQPLQSGSNRA